MVIKLDVLMFCGDPSIVSGQKEQTIVLGLFGPCRLKRLAGRAIP